MSDTTDQVETCGRIAANREDYRLRAIVADGSSQYMETVLAVLELHDCVDLIGRAANFEETIELVVNHQPDLVLVDLGIPCVNLVVPATVLCTCAAVRIVGLSQGVVSSHANDLLMAVDALIQKQELWHELLPVIRALYGGHQVVSPIGRTAQLTSEIKSDGNRRRKRGCM